jgi:ketosteroid isomerase-like protein
VEKQEQTHNPRMSDARADALTWLRTFEAACRRRDFEAGRRLFAPDAVAFGTYATAVHGLDNIEREQWRQIWPRIRDFRFEET